jgi:hypothetical protein
LRSAHGESDAPALSQLITERVAPEIVSALRHRYPLAGIDNRVRLNVRNGDVDEIGPTECVG